MKKNLASACAVLVALSVFSITGPAHAINWFPWKKAPVKVEKPVVQPEAVKPVVTPVAAPVVAPVVKPVVKPVVQPIVKPQAKPSPCANKPCPVKKPVQAVKKAAPKKV